MLHFLHIVDYSLQVDTCKNISRALCKSPNSLTVRVYNYLSSLVCKRRDCPTWYCGCGDRMKSDTNKKTVKLHWKADVGKGHQATCMEDPWTKEKGG